MGIGLGMSQGSGGVAAAAPDPLLTGLRAFYRNNGTDRSGNGLNLTTLGSPTTGPGIDGAANAAAVYPNNGSDFYYKLSQHIVTGTELTVSGWVKLPVGFSDGIGTYLYKADGSVGVVRLYVYYNVAIDEFPYAYANVQDVPHGSATLSGFDFDTSWHHLVLVLGSGQLSLFVDGVLLATTPSAVSIGGAIGNCRIGDGSVSGGCSQQFVGFWSRAISFGGVSVGQPATAGSDVARLWNSGNGFDPTA